MLCFLCSRLRMNSLLTHRPQQQIIIYFLPANMSATTVDPTSNITAAFTAKSDSVDIPKHREADAGHVPPSKFPTQLLTPPNSISPTLPPHKARSPCFNVAGTRYRTPDSDIDLQDA